MGYISAHPRHRPAGACMGCVATSPPALLHATSQSGAQNHQLDITLKTLPILSSPMRAQLLPRYQKWRNLRLNSPTLCMAWVANSRDLCGKCFCIASTVSEGRHTHRRASGADAILSSIPCGWSACRLAAADQHGRLAVLSGRPGHRYHLIHSRVYPACAPYSRRCATRDSLY